MGLLFLVFLLLLIAVVRPDPCPTVCTCEDTALSNLPINSVLVRSQHHKPTDEHLPSYHSRNEVLDETDEHQAQHELGNEKLKAATCLLQPSDNLPLFLSLPSDLQALTILHGPGITNLTLDGSYFQHLRKLLVLEIHGFQHGHGVLRLRNNALKNLEILRYINLQHVHLLGNRNIGNRPVPKSGVQFIDSNIIPGADRFTLQENEKETNEIPEAIIFIPYQGDADIVPYNVYQDQQERAGLSTFAGLRSLIFLRAFHCNIKEVNWEMFYDLEQLEYLSLEGNKIPFLHEFSFYGTPNLKHLTISHNRMLDIQSIGLAGLLKLEILDLSYNNISHLSELSLPPLPQLILADFHHNPIEQILPYTFQIMNNTEQLFLGGKQDKLEIRHNSFSGLTKLRKLSLNGIHLKVLEREYLKGMSRLSQLRIEGTINELAFDAFAEVPKIQELILKHCSIHKISMDAFFGLYGLMYLDLSHNELEALPPSLLDQQSVLKEINLNNNKLTTLPEGLFLNVPAKLIRLDKNPWHCTCAMDEWQPSQINKIKVKITDNSLCQTRYDKGSMCKIHYIYQYVYEQNVSPRCATPTRFSGWGVFHLLRKHLRCHKKYYKHKSHLQKDKFHKNKIHHINEKVNEILHSNNQSNSSLVTKIYPATGAMRYMADSQVPTTGFKKDTVEDDSKNNQNAETTESTYNFTTISVTGQNTAEIQNIVLNPIHTIGIHQNKWTKKDKEKYSLLQDKQERVLQKINTTTIIKKDKLYPMNFKMNIDVPTKVKKQSDTLKKWELKMQNTMRRLNTVPRRDFTAL